MTLPDPSEAIIRSVLMPCQGMTLLLPNAAVSEVVAYEEPEELAETGESWLLGTQVWRQQIIPLVSFERLLGKPFSLDAKRLMVAVCNTLGGDKNHPYIGLLLSDIPHLLRAHHSMIDQVEAGASANGLVRAVIRVNGELLTIPDLDTLEVAVNKMLD